MEAVRRVPGIREPLLRRLSRSTLVTVVLATSAPACFPARVPSHRPSLNVLPCPQNYSENPQRVSQVFRLKFTFVKFPQNGNGGTVFCVFSLLPSFIAFLENTRKVGKACRHS